MRGNGHILKVSTVLGATALVLLGVGDLAGAAKTGGAATQGGAPIIAVLGPKTTVKPGKFVRAYAMCPKGYFVTGGGFYAGAITEIISSPLPNLRGWFVDGTNTSKAERTFQHRAIGRLREGHARHHHDPGGGPRDAAPRAIRLRHGPWNAGVRTRAISRIVDGVDRRGRGGARLRAQPAILTDHHADARALARPRAAGDDADTHPHSLRPRTHADARVDAGHDSHRAGHLGDPAEGRRWRRPRSRLTPLPRSRTGTGPGHSRILGIGARRAGTSRTALSRHRPRR